MPLPIEKPSYPSAACSLLEDNDADDGASGRYDDMDSVTDLIISPSLAWNCR